MSDSSSEEPSPTLQAYLRKPCNFEIESSLNYSTSLKAWATQELWNWTLQSNKEPDFIRHWGTNTQEDVARWDITHDVPLLKPYVRSEDEAVKAFNLQVEQPVEMAFRQLRHQLQFRSGFESPFKIPNRPYQPIADKSVWFDGRPLSVGEIKAPPLINPTSWTKQRGASRDTTLTRLSNETYNYAMIYRSAQAFLCDCRYLVLLAWPAGPHIINSMDFSCPPNCWIIPATSGGQNITMRLAFYYLIRRAWFLALKHDATIPAVPEDVLDLPNYKRILAVVLAERPGLLPLDFAQKIAYQRCLLLIQAAQQST